MTLKLNCLIFSLTALATVALRSLMLLFTIDPVSGFVRTEYALPNLFITIGLVAACLIVFVTAMLLGTKQTEEIKLNNIPMLVACVSMAVAMIYETFFSSLLEGANLIQSMLHYALTAGSAAVLIIAAVMKFLKLEYPKILTLIPVIYWILRLIIVFTSFSKISAISDTIIETATMCLTLITFLAFSKIECDQPIKRYKLYFATALLCGIVSIMSSVPRIIAFFGSAAHPQHLNTTPVFTGLAVAFFSISFAYSLYNEIKN